MRAFKINRSLTERDISTLSTLEGKIENTLKERVRTEGSYAWDGALEASIYLKSREFRNREGAEFEMEIVRLRRGRDPSGESITGNSYYVDVMPLSINHGNDPKLEQIASWNRVRRVAQRARDVLGMEGDPVKVDAITPDAVRVAFGSGSEIPMECLRKLRRSAIGLPQDREKA